MSSARFPEITFTLTALRGGLLVAALLLVAGVLYVVSFDSTFGRIDFLQYWAASRAWGSGQNPYDAQVLLDLQREVWRGPESYLPVRMWNPPLILALLFPLQFLSFSTAATLWVLLSLLLYTAAALLSARAVMPRRYLPSVGRASAVVIVTYYPFALAWWYGQSTPLLFAGLAMFLFFSRKAGDQWASSFNAGLALSLTLLKPHILYLVYLFFLLAAIRQRQAKGVLGFLSGAAVLFLGSLSGGVEVWEWYVTNMQSPPVDWKNPVIGSWLGVLRGEGGASVALRLLPAFGVVVLGSIWVLRRVSAEYPWEVLIVILPISVVTAPYGWTYDLLMVLPTVLWLVVQGSWSRSHYLRAAVLAAVTVGLLPAGGAGQEWAVWYGVLVSGLALWQISKGEPQQR